MKKTITRFTLGLALCTGSLFGQAPIPELLYYKFDGTGTSVPNLASNPPVGTTTATIMGGQSQGSTGQCGGALVGSGGNSSTDYVNTNWATNLTGTSWTISFWSNNVPSTTSTQYILGDVNAGGFRCFTGGVANPGNWILRGGFVDVYANGGASTAPTMTTFVYDMPNNQIRSYVNGVLNSTVAQTAVTINGTGPFKVGAYSSSAGLPNTSLMDEFRVYNRALTVAEIQSLLYVYTSSTISPLSCSPTYTAPSGAVYSASGTYMDTIPNYLNCDSIITINLTMASPSAASISPTVCDMYTAPSGAMLMASGTYMDTIPNMAGCDSVITINLTVNNSTAASISPTVCDAYTAPSGATYMSSGTYMDTIPNMMGCDSVITINLTVNTTTTSSMSATVCDSYVAPSGATYMSSGTYMDTIPNMMGCDSVITINLTVNSSTSSSINDAACYNYVSPSGNYNWTSSGTYMDTIPNMSGCDSVITVNLTIQASSSSFSVTACDSYTSPGGMVITSSGTYMDTIPNMAGCDSAMTIQVTINNVNTIVTQNNFTLTASASGAMYQWVDCNNNFAAVGGATNQSFTPTVDGSYAVIVTENSCTDTSACFPIIGIGMGENAFAQHLELFPNPTNGSFTIDLGGLYSEVIVNVADVTGRVIMSEQKNQANLLTLDLNAPAGTYLVTVIAGEERAVIRLVKD